jgi:hypothetical protein
MKIVRKKQQKEASKEKDKVSEMLEEFEDKGIVFSSNKSIDAEYLELPTYLDTATTTDLGRYMHTLTQQLCYVRGVQAQIAAYVRIFENELNIEKLRIFKALPARMSITEKELNLLDDDKAKVIIEQLNHYDNKLETLNAYLKNLNDSIFNVSRELTRRIGDGNVFGRNENVQNTRRK